MLHTMIHIMLPVIILFVVFFIISVALADCVLSFILHKLNITLPEYLYLAVALHLIPMFGYSMYLIHLSFPFVANAFSYVFYIIAIIYIIFMFANEKRIFAFGYKESKIQITIIFSYVIIIACIAASLPLTIHKRDGLDSFMYTEPLIFSYNMFRVPHGAQHDTSMQYLYAAKDISPFNNIRCHYETALSDRPPVIGGTSFLLKDPIAKFASGNNHFSKPWYTAVSLALTTAWISVLWGLLRSLKVEPLRAVLIIVAASTAHWMLFNSFYFWPRMLTSSYVLLAMLCYDPIFNNRQHFTGNAKGIFPALFLSFALLTHLVSILGIFLWGVTLFVRRQLNIKHVFLCATMAIAVLCTWYIPKAVNEEPRPSMFRYLLADRYNPQIYLDSSISDLHAIIKTYQGKQFNDIVKDKLQHIQRVSFAFPFDSWYTLPGFIVTMLGIAGWLLLFGQRIVSGSWPLSNEVKTLIKITLFLSVSLWLFWAIAPYKHPINSGVADPFINTLYMFLFLMPFMYLPIRIVWGGVLLAVCVTFANLAALDPIAFSCAIAAGGFAWYKLQAMIYDLNSEYRLGIVNKDEQP